MADARTLALKDLKEIVTDAEELSKGVRIADDGGLEHLARFESKLFADAKGSGASPYKVQVTVEDAVKGRCSCMAARSRPFCKHAAALLVTWARSPGAFAVAEVAPTAPAGDAKKKEVKKGKTDTADLIKQGVEQVATLVRELAVAGVASLSADRPAQVRALGENLRESKLRRLSARTQELADLLEHAARQTTAFAPSTYAELLADMVLTVRKLEKHLGGEALDDKYVEELIGRTWTKKDRKPVAGLELVEYAFISRTTADDYVIRESRLLDLASGEHYSEKQILPAFLAKRTEPKKSWTERLLRSAGGSLYPSFSPLRLDLDDPGTVEPLAEAHLESLLARCLPSVGAALAAFQERRKDVFAPDLLPVALAVDTVLAEGGRMQVVDSEDAALFLPADPSIEEKLAGALRGAKLRALLGDVAIDGALPTLFPLAAIVQDARGLELRGLGGADAASIISSRKVQAPAPGLRAAPRESWADTARAAGASSAAIALGEVREELAEALVTGLTALGPRVTEPLASRLQELGLTKQADLLSAAAAKPDAADRLDDFVKLYQVLGIALTRLVGAAHVERANLEAVPTYESVQVMRPERTLEPREVAALAGQGKLNRYQAAVHYARYYESIPAEQLAASIYPTWADGSAAPYIARAFASRPEQAIIAARRALGLDPERNATEVKRHAYWYWRRPTARVARLTAVRVLETIGGPEAEALLLAVENEQHGDPALRAHAGRARYRVQARLGNRPMLLRLEDTSAIRQQLLTASQKYDRMAALQSLVEHADIDAIPLMRASFGGDVSQEVREQAAYALGRIGDVESVDTFVQMVRRRTDDPAAAKIGAYALGHLGDVRGIDVLLDAYAEGWQPGIVADAIRQIGSAALEPLMQLIERRPEIAGRKAALGVIGALPAQDVADYVCDRLGKLADEADFVERALVLLTVAAVHPAAAAAASKRVLELRPAIAEKSATKEEKALLKKCQKAA